MHSLAPPGLTAFSLRVRWFAPPANLRHASGVRLREPASTLAKFMTRNSRVCHELLLWSKNVVPEGHRTIAGGANHRLLVNEGDKPR